MNKFEKHLNNEQDETSTERLLFFESANDFEVEKAVTTSQTIQELCSWGSFLKPSLGSSLFMDKVLSTRFCAMQTQDDSCLEYVKKHRAIKDSDSFDYSLPYKACVDLKCFYQPLNGCYKRHKCMVRWTENQKNRGRTASGHNSHRGPFTFEETQAILESQQELWHHNLTDETVDKTAELEMEENPNQTKDEDIFNNSQKPRSTYFGKLQSEISERLDSVYQNSKRSHNSILSDQLDGHSAEGIVVNQRVKFSDRNDNLRPNSNSLKDIVKKQRFNSSERTSDFTDNKWKGHDVLKNNVANTGYSGNVILMKKKKPHHLDAIGSATNMPRVEVISAFNENVKIPSIPSNSRGLDNIQIDCLQIQNWTEKEANDIIGISENLPLTGTKMKVKTSKMRYL